MSEHLDNFELHEAEYNGLLCGVANHEAKALTIALMVAESIDENKVFGSRDLDKLLRAAQGTNPGWITSRRAPYTFCERSFASVGAVAKESIINANGQEIIAYGLTPLGKMHGLAMAGLTLDWSLRHPNLSVQTILGATQTKGTLRAPVYRTAILESLLTAGDDGISIRGIKADHPELPRIEHITSGLRHTAFENIVTLVSRTRDFDPLVYINNPEYSGARGATVDDFSLSTQAMYGMMRHLVANEGINEIRTSEFVEKAKDLYPEIPPEQIRAMLLSAATSTNTRLPGIQLSTNDDSELKGSETSNLRVSEEYRQPISDLLSELDNLKSGIKTEHYRKRALQIASDPIACAEIMAKAAEHSSKVQVSRAAVPVGQLIMSMMQAASEPITSQDIREKLSSDHDISITIKAVHNYLTKAIKDGAATKALIRRERQGRARSHMGYSLISNT